MKTHQSQLAVFSADGEYIEHLDSYRNFLQLVKWGAAVCVLLLVGLVIVLG